MKLADTRSFEAINVGDALPTIKKTFNASDLMAYGAATWDWHRLHYDADYVAARGLEKPVIDGQMFGAIFAREIGAWIGPRGFIEKLSVSYRSMAFAGDLLLLEGSVSDTVRRSDVGVVTIEQTLKNADRLVSTAHGVVRVPLS